MKREVWVDYAKVFGIYCVILAHTMLYKPLQNWIYVFHMPLFFFLSGYLFNFERNASFKTFALKRFRQLMIPYFTFNLITYLFWLFIGRHVGADSGFNTPWWEPAVYTVFGYGDKMVHNVPLWFFMCLYIIQLAYYKIFKKRTYVWLWILLFASIGFLNYTFNPLRLPFSLGTAFVGIVFYAVGNLLSRINIKPSFSIGLACVAITIVVALFNGRINMHINYYNNYLLFLIGAFAGIYMVFCLCRVFKRIKLIEYISQNTLTICGLHLLTFSLMKGMMLYMFHLSPNILAGTIWGNFLFALISMALTLFASYIINRYFPAFIGRKK